MYIPGQSCRFPAKPIILFSEEKIRISLPEKVPNRGLGSKSLRKHCGFQNSSLSVEKMQLLDFNLKFKTFMRGLGSKESFRFFPHASWNYMNSEVSS